jgi:predicted nucleic acid-binding protein
VLSTAKSLHVVDRVSFWDSLLLAVCKEAGVTRLYSEDLPGRVRPADIEVINPFC